MLTSVRLLGRKVFGACTCAVARRALPQLLVRHLHLQEHYAKEMLNKFGVAIQRGDVAYKPEQAVAIAKSLSVPEYVVKAQILAGGRGKGTFSNGFQGGVHLTTKPEDVGRLAEQMLGNRLVTKQTGKEGIEVKKVLVCESVTIVSEKYLAIILDRGSGGPVVVASHHGGMDIEQVAVEHPEEVIRMPLKIDSELSTSDALSLASSLRFPKELQQNAANQIQKLYEVFKAYDTTLLEINPFAETSDGRVIAVDAKINFDDNAEFRQKELFQLRDTSEEDPREVQASAFGLNYVGLDGNIGCMVNGAGLAMATMDLIKLHGGEPANFLDVGGSATTEQVREAFKILTNDQKVQAILVNIFGGIMRCDVIAEGIVEAARDVGLRCPLVVRLAGTNVEKGKEILKNSDLHLLTADDLDDAAKKAVASLTS